MDKDKWDELRECFLRDPLPRRLGGLAATLGCISFSARKSTDPNSVLNLLDEAKHIIEWTAADTEPETAAELVQIQILITLWQRVWIEDVQNPRQRLYSPTRQRTGQIMHLIFRDWLEKRLVPPISTIA